MNIPLYVYILFFALLYMGIKRCFSRVIKVQRLMIAPLFFTFLSVRGMLTLFNIHTADVMLWILGSIVGVLIGYLHVRNRRLKADHARQLLQIPGDWSMLCLILAIFGVEFFVHYSIDAGFKISTTFVFKWFSLIILGLIAGMSIGRTLNYYLKYQKALSESLPVSMCST